MLTLDHVSYRYAGARTPSLLDISLTLPAGQVIGVAGPSEAGKTTLCLVAAGLAPRTIGGALRGRLLIDGRDVAAEPIHALVDSVGIVFSSPGTQLTGVALTVYEEVAFGPMNLGLPRSEVIERTHEALATLRIDGLADRDPARLSGGQQQLVGIAGLLALRPAHLVLDEPTAHLDPAGTRLVASALERLAAAGASILVAEQKTDLLAGICDRVLALSGGRAAIEGPASEVLASPALRQTGVAPPAAVRIRTRLEEDAVPAAMARRVASVLASLEAGREEGT